MMNKEIRPGLNWPDWPITDDFGKNINAIVNWSYYDNYQHGHYVNENDFGYGPIRVFNSTINVEGVQLFQGDVSKARLDFMKEMTNKHKGLELTIVYEYKNRSLLVKEGKVFAGRPNELWGKPTPETIEEMVDW